MSSQASAVESSVETVSKLDFQVPDIRCAACALKIERELQKRPDVSRCTTHLPTRHVVVEGKDLHESALESAIRDLGYSPRPWSARLDRSAERTEKHSMMIRLGIAGIGTMQVMMYALADYVSGPAGLDAVYASLMQWASLAVAIPVTFYSAMPFHRNAFSDIKNKSVGMDVPVSLAILSAFFLSSFNLLAGAGQVYFDSLSMFTFLLLLGRFLEMGSRHKYQHSIDLGDSCLPLTAQLVDSGDPVLVKKLTGGEVVIAPAGEVIPADGMVLEGTSQVNEAAFTGESFPVTRKPGSRVLAGSLNLDADLKVSVSTGYDEFVLCRMNQQYQQASRYRPAFSVMADRIARYFVSAILVLAFVSGLGWFLAGSSDWFQIALTVLVVSCPCALSLATPVVYTVALTALRERGIVVSSGRFLEKLGEVTTLVFDKTGTVTTGQLKLSQVVILDRTFSESDILKLSAALEAPSAHPIARALSFRHSHAVNNAKVIPGEGVSGVIGGSKFRIGKSAFVCPGQSLKPPDREGIWVLLGSNEQALAWIQFQDTLRSGLKGFMSALAAHYRLFLLTGDQQREAERVASLSDLELLQAECSPEDKLRHIASLQQGGSKVLMVGDGINDASAMAAAHASLAVSPVDIVVQEAADATLLRQDLGAVSVLLDYAQRVRRIITQNMTWALGYNFLAIPLAMSGSIEPWMAALGMSLSSLIVVGNANRLHWIRDTVMVHDEHSGTHHSMTEVRV